MMRYDRDKNMIMVSHQELTDRWRRERAYHDSIRHQELVAMAFKPRVRVKAKGIPIAGVLVRTDDNGKTRIVKNDSAPPHVRAGRRRKAGKITGARAAK